jgi:hypothetical protein
MGYEVVLDQVQPPLASVLLLLCQPTLLLLCGATLRLLSLSTLCCSSMRMPTAT